jgi:hypothetical protein
MKCDKCGALNQEGEKFCARCGDNIPNPMEESKTGKYRVIRGLKLAGAVSCSVLICIIIIVLLMGMWITMTFIFGTILGLSLVSPLSWAIGGVLPVLTLFLALSQKNERRIYPL